ncbi:MAG: dihydroneopterin aldolase [Phycisphaerae bacterium]|nr:dihydroneopterin aldolase [Phycisphaerae bacterium]
MNSRERDRIHIRDLRLRCVIGVNPEERRVRQDVVVDITLHADLRQAGQSDRMSDTVDYKAIKLAVVDLVEASQCHLVERLAEQIAQLCLERPRVRRVRVLVEKPGALRYARTVGVEIVRGGEGDEL